MSDIGKYFIGAGILLLVIGTFLSMAGKIPFLGKLPGDIIIKKESFKFYFPFMTCILISLFASFIFYLMTKR